MSEILCPKCSRPWCDHVGDGHDEPICPTKPEHRCPSCECAALRAEVERLEEKVRRIESACGLPDPAEACRVILAIAAEEGK